MASATILIVSSDKDFSQPLAEQVKKELGLDCRVAENHEAAKAIGSIALVVSSEANASYDCPQLVVTKPIRLPQLLAEITDALQKPAANEALSLGAYELHPRSKQLAYKNKQVTLTDKEVQLLQQLAKAGRKGMAKDQLLKNIWGIGEALDTHTLETHIYRLRGKFRELAGDDTIVAASDGGYVLKAAS